MTQSVESAPLTVIRTPRYEIAPWHCLADAATMRIITKGGAQNIFEAQRKGWRDQEAIASDRWGG